MTLVFTTSLVQEEASGGLRNGFAWCEASEMGLHGQRHQLGAFADHANASWRAGAGAGPTCVLVECFGFFDFGNYADRLYHPDRDYAPPAPREGPLHTAVAVMGRWLYFIFVWNRVQRCGRRSLAAQRRPSRLKDRLAPDQPRLR